MTAPKLRILQVMRAPVGGLFRHVADLTRALADAGHSVGLAVDSLARDAQTDTRLDELLPHTALGIHRFAMPRLLGAGDLTTPFRISRLAKSLDIDVLHGHGAKGGFYARLARLAGSRAQALYTPHGGVLHFDVASPTGRVFHMLERSLMRQTGAIIFESAYAQAIYAEAIGTPTCPTKVIHNGLASEEFTPVVGQKDAADFVFVGELRELKGVHVLIDALSGVTRPDGTPATLVMVGDGSRRDALASQVNQLGLSARVELPGAQPARASFARGRVVVVPSLAESLPYVVLEAVAAGLPVIATRVGGIPEIFGPSAARLIEPGDAASLRRAMQAALDSPGSTAKEASALNKYVSEHFSLDRMAGEIEALYLTLHRQG